MWHVASEYMSADIIRGNCILFKVTVLTQFLERKLTEYLVFSLNLFDAFSFLFTCQLNAIYYL